MQSNMSQNNSLAPAGIDLNHTAQQDGVVAAMNLFLSAGKRLLSLKVMS